MPTKEEMDKAWQDAHKDTTPADDTSPTNVNGKPSREEMDKAWQDAHKDTTTVTQPQQPSDLPSEDVVAIEDVPAIRPGGSPFTGKTEHIPRAKKSNIRPIDWGKAFGNIPRDAIQNIMDLRHLPSASVMLPSLAKELLLLPTALFNKNKGKFPILSSIEQFYANNYDIRTARGRDRFNRYVEEHPTQFLSDIVAIGSSVFVPAIGAGLKGTKVAGLVQKLNASQHLAKATRGTARVIEAGIDPASAVGRLGADKLSNLRAKNKIKFEDKTSLVPDDPRTGVLPLFGNKGIAKIDDFDKNILNDAWKDGFKPDALKKYLKQNPTVQMKIVTESNQLDIHQLAELLASNTTSSKLKSAIRRGTIIASKIPPGVGTAVTGALGQFTQWQYYLIGITADFINWRLPKDVALPKWFYREPPGWKEFAKKAGVTIGRSAQRRGRIMEEQEKQAIIERFRGDNLRQ